MFENIVVKNTCIIPREVFEESKILLKEKGVETSYEFLHTYCMIAFGYRVDLNKCSSTVQKLIFKYSQEIEKNEKQYLRYIKKKERDAKPKNQIPKMDFLNQEAERMRNNPTDGESRFKELCDQYGIQYEFQKPVIIGRKGFILDFSIISSGNPKKGDKSRKRKIAVEIDGEYHDTAEQKLADAARTKSLRGLAYDVFRLTNYETMTPEVMRLKFLAFLQQIGETVISAKLKTPTYKIGYLAPTCYRSAR